jgi:hypothetical protein
MYGTCKPPPQNYTADQCLRPEIRRATYFDIATSYGFADYFFQTSQGPSLPAHQFLLSGTSAPLPFNDANDPCSAANFQTLSFSTATRVYTHRGRLARLSPFFRGLRHFVVIQSERLRPSRKRWAFDSLQSQNGNHPPRTSAFWLIAPLKTDNIYATTLAI